MAKFKYQDNNSSIIFNNVTKPSYTTSGRIAKGTYTTDGNGYITTKGYLINAIDIDWNEAELRDNTIIKSTTNLLERLDNTYTCAESDAKYLTSNSLDSININIQSLEENIQNVYNKQDSDSKYVSIETYNSLLETINQLSAQIQELQAYHSITPAPKYFYIGLSDNEDSASPLRATYTIENNIITNVLYSFDFTGFNTALNVTEIATEEGIEHEFTNARYIVLPEEWYNQIAFMNSNNWPLDAKVNRVSIDDISYIVIDSSNNYNYDSWTSPIIFKLVSENGGIINSQTGLPVTVDNVEYNDSKVTELVMFNKELTENNIIEYIESLPQEKPETAKTINMDNNDKPSSEYLIYPLAWEEYDQATDTLISPKIYDENGFEMGVSWHGDLESSIINHNNVQYRILDIELGKGLYTIEF